MAAGDLTTLDNVHGWLGLDSSQTEDDVLLTRLISAASGFMQTCCNRQFALQSYAETRDGNGTVRLFLKQYPIAAVASLVISGQTIAAGDPVSAPGYYFDSYSLMLNGFAFRRGMANVAINYTAGFAAIPLDLEQACIELVGVKYKRKDHIDRVSDVLANQTTSYSQRDMPAEVATVLQTYKRVLPL